MVGLAIGPGQFAFAALGLFIKPLGTEFGWSRSGISLALTAFTVVLALSMPVVGHFVDRLGSRRVLIPAVFAVGVLLAAVGALISQLWHLMLIFVLIGSLGAGANSLPYMRTIAAWFEKRRGLAIGIAMAGSGIGYAFVPPAVQYMIDHYGWRSGYYLLAAITILIGIPVLLRWFRDSPAELGLVPDGDSRIEATVEGDASVVGFTRAAALKSGRFWLLFGIFAVLSFSLYGLLPHLVPMLTDRGISTVRAALVASTIGYTIILARVVIGYLIDRFFAPRVAVFFFFLSAVGMGILATGTSSSVVFLATVLIGFSIGAEIDLMAYLASRYFGLRHYGAIYGVLFASLLVGTSLGPVSYGLAYEQ